jgi:hypothetical protein
VLQGRAGAAVVGRKISGPPQARNRGNTAQNPNFCAESAWAMPTPHFSCCALKMMIFTAR